MMTRWRTRGLVAVLDHLGECVGIWIYTPADAEISCSGCARRYPQTPERVFAAAFDLVLADHMQELAARGAAILAAERRR